MHEPAWKETKNACLLTMSSESFAEDPHPALPTCFQQQTYVEKLVRQMHAAATSGLAKNGENSSLPAAHEHSACDAAEDGPPSAPEDSSPAAAPRAWRPQRLVRSCLSSLCSSDEFGPLVAGEAQRRGFYQAARRAFLGDGQAWNWTLHERHFADFVPITDFVHPLGYLYEAAQALAPRRPGQSASGLPKPVGKVASEHSPVDPAGGRGFLLAQPVGGDQLSLPLQRLSESLLALPKR